MATKELFNTVVNWFIRQRIDQIQNFMDHPVETQNGILFSQLFHAEDTEYGKKYGEQGQGGGRMPGFGGIYSDEQIKSIVEYVRSL